MPKCRGSNPQRRDTKLYFSHVQGGGDANCYNLYRIEASPSNQSTPLTQGPMFPTVSGGEDNSVSVTSGLVRNTVYSVSIVSVNINGENPSKGGIQFSEYKMISLQYYSSTYIDAVLISNCIEIFYYAGVLYSLWVYSGMLFGILFLLCLYAECVC